MNGWKNWETWKANLEIIDDCSLIENEELVDEDDLQTILEEALLFTEDMNFKKYFANVLANEFISEVDLKEIAECINDEIKFNKETPDWENA